MPTASEAAREEPLAGPLYCDASALAKLFLPEEGSTELNSRLFGRDDVLIADLALTEVASALGRRAREGGLRDAAARRIYRRILATLADGAFRRVDLLSSTHREAERLLLASDRAPLRAADALHLALALGAGAGTVLTYDRVLARAARAQSLAVWPEVAS
ncbi:MAG: type II toxin-antitoxin system VapC family toxin [Thermoanaerobaculia bacterium]